jgi:hypothetical protein
MKNNKSKLWFWTPTRLSFDQYRQMALKFEKEKGCKILWETFTQELPFKAIEEKGIHYGTGCQYVLTPH